MNIYRQELQALKNWDEIQGIEELGNGYKFIYTASHGYLVVPNNDKNIEKARQIVEYGFIGKNAVYLEEDCEAGAFYKAIGLL